MSSLSLSRFIFLSGKQILTGCWLAGWLVVISTEKCTVLMVPSFKPDVPSGEGKEEDRRNGGDGNGKDVSMIIAEETGQKVGEEKEGNFVSSIT